MACRKPRIEPAGTKTSPKTARVADQSAGHFETRFGQAKQSRSVGYGGHTHRGSSSRAIAEIDGVWIQRIGGRNRASCLRRVRTARQINAPSARRRVQGDSALARLPGRHADGCPAHRWPSDHRRRVRANIIDNHQSWIRCGVVRRPRPTAGSAYSQIQQQKDICIERPRRSRGNITDGADEENFAGIVHIELNHVRRPDGAVGMKGGIHLSAARKGIALT